MNAVLAYFDRVGGVFVRPRAALRSILWNQSGTLWGVLPWALVFVATVSPSRVGRAGLMLRVDPIDAFRLLAQSLSERVGPPFLAALIVAIALVAMGRARGHGTPGFSAALDAAVYALLPFLVLGTVGQALARMGIELSALPHRRLQGDLPMLIARFVVGYGWSIGLGVVLLIEAYRGDGGRA